MADKTSDKVETALCSPESTSAKDETCRTTDMNEVLGATICSAESTSSTKEEICRTLPEEALNHFLQGKRHMLVQDYKFAVASLTEACDQYTKHYGELAIECGEVYFLYGKALFRYSQEQSGVFGDVLNEDEEKENENDSDDDDDEEEEGDADDGNDDEKEQEDSKNEEVQKEPSESTDSPQGLDANDGEAITSTEANLTLDVPESSSVEQVTPGEVANCSAAATPGRSPDENDQLEDDLELAWNALETAKAIFNRQGNNKEAQLKIAEILQLLAEISMESDNNVSAIQDLKECLKIQKKYLSPDDRIVAETYYQMGLAHVLDKQYHEGIDNFKSTKEIIELKIKNLKMLPVPDTPVPFDEDPKFEIANLENILPDIKEKIEDTEELIKNAKKELQNAIVKAGEVSSSSGSTSNASNGSKPISNITHLLKRKKPDQDNENEIETKKRLKLTTCASNGDVNMLPDTTSEANV